MRWLDAIKVVLEIAQIALGGLFVFGLWSLKAGRWLERHEKEPLSVVPKPANGYGSTEWRPRIEALERDVARLETSVAGADGRRADLILDNHREHDELAKRIDRNEALLNAHQRRLDQLADRE